MLNRSPQCGSTALDPVLDFVSLNVEGWENSLLVDVWIIGYSLKEKSISLSASDVDPLLTSSSFVLGVLGEHLVIGFLGGIFL
jgi:hypothetical protein